jgi:hypothetical protein
MTNSEFFEQYKDPKWQKKRLEIMKRDKFCCQSCYTDEKTLNVHHCTVYKKDAKPWRYKNSELITLCETCHTEISSFIKEGTASFKRNCHSVDTAMETMRVIKLLEGLNPPQLNRIAKMIKSINNE